MFDPLQIIEKFYPVSGEAYHILTSHSKQVRDLALEISEKHPEFQLDNVFLTEASMLHDIGIFLCDAPRIHCYGEHQYIEHGYLGAEILLKEGLPRHALVCERHTGTGLTLETIKQNHLPLPLREMLPISKEEQVICYADKFFSKTQLGEKHSVERIRTYLGRFGEAELARFDVWHTLFGV